MSFHEVQFPTNISYGSSGGPGFSTAVVETDSGAEERVARWADARHKFDAAYGVKDYADLSAVKAFYIARQGCSIGFRYKDWADFTSNPTDPSFKAAKGTEDQLIGTGDGAAVSFQLIKTYTSGGINRTRKITKPVTGTIQVWVNSVLKTIGVDFTVDTTTGVVLFGSAPTAGHSVRASFEFDVPVRFGTEIDDVLSMNFESWGEGAIGSIPLIEIVDPDPGYVGELCYGGAYEVSSAANLTMSTGLGYLWVVSMTTASKSVNLPVPTAIPPGGWIFELINGGSNSFTLKDHNGTTLATLAAGTGIDIALTRTSGGTLVWIAA